MLWERLHPAARTLPDFDALDRVAQIVQATTPAGGRRAPPGRSSTRSRSGPEPVGISATDRRWLQHADGTLEETMHLGTVPQETSPWWLAHLLQVPLPCTVAVHVTVGDRSRTRTAQRRRWARLRAAVSYKERRGQLVGSDEEDALDEAQQLDRELRSTVAATVYNVATYVSFRQLDGDDDRVRRAAEDRRPRVSVADRRPRAARRVPQRPELAVHAADRRRPAARDPRATRSATSRTAHRW